MTSIYLINNELGWSFGDFLASDELKVYRNVFVTDSISQRSYFIKSFFGGMFIIICMTGLGQDMMQKSLKKCKKKKMVLFSIVLTLVTFLFLLLRVLLYIYAKQENIAKPIMNN